MEHIAVFINDAEHARRTLEPLLARGAAPTRWLMVLCAPRLTRHAGRWTSRSAKAHWRQEWAAQARESLAPLTRRTGDAESFEWLVAQGPLAQTTQQLRARVGAGLRVLDARRLRAGAVNEPLVAGQKPIRGEQEAAPWLAASALSLMLALAD